MPPDAVEPRPADTFAVALSEFCRTEGLLHLGFVALDTPVLTCRDADDDAQGCRDMTKNVRVSVA